MEKLSDRLHGLADEFTKMAEESQVDDADIYRCPLCRDCGWIIEGSSARPCVCRQQEQQDQRRLPLPHLQRMLFENFDLQLYPANIKTANGNSYRQLAREALSAAMAFANSLAKGINRPGLIFEGTVGSGKTFLAAAIANDLLAKGVDVEFIVVPEFLDQLRQQIHSNGDSESALILRIQEAPVLIFDDMGAHNFSPWVQNILFTIINYRLNHQLPIIITTNLNMDELCEAIGERIASRLMEIGTNVRLFVDKDIRLKLFRDGRDQW